MIDHPNRPTLAIGTKVRIVAHPPFMSSAKMIGKTATILENALITGNVYNTSFGPIMLGDIAGMAGYVWVEARHIVKVE